MTDESFMLDIDIIEKEHEKQLAEIIVAKDAEIAGVIADKDAQIAALKAQLEQVTSD